jgi:Domain of unknown function (DUF5666)
MKFALPRSSYWPALPLLLVATFMAGCAAGGSGTGTALTGNTSVTVLASSTANDQLSELAVGITGITLTNKEGKTVTLLSTTTQELVEFMHLNGGIEPLTTVSIPQDVYTSATVSVNGGVPICETFEPLSGNPGTYAVMAAQASGVTSNLSAPITVTGTSMGLELNLQVSKSTNYSTCAGIVNGPIPFAFTPTFDLTPVTFAAEPTNSANGMATGLRGMIETVTNNGTSFSVAGDFGARVSPPTWQVTSNSSTVFQGIPGASQLAVGMPVDMDAAIQADGTLLATRVAVYDTTPSNLSFSIGPQAYVTASVPVMNPLAFEDQGPAYVGYSGGPTIYNFGNAAFQISGQMANVSTLPFTASFSGTNMVPGQNIFVTTHSPLNSQPYQATTVTLLPQTINGTVSAISNSGSFTTYTISLAAYDLFPDLAVLPGQATLLTNPGSVVVYVDSNTQMQNTTPLAVGSVVRFNGLVFNDNGTLRMDCAQISDGVAE